MKRWFGVSAVTVVVALLAGPLRAELRLPVQIIADAITAMDTDRARQLLEAEGTGVGLAFQRARLAIAVGDCDSAEARLGTMKETEEAERLLELARGCARAVSGGRVIERTEQGVWLRLQDEEDAALVPYIADVVVAARAQLERDLGVSLPKPLRIDLVRDLFSLAKVSGLPVEAAETTGTVAVARWGRVTMLSPRATPTGYPWQDTLAHEMTHLALTRASLDYAPLWLQEGIAKREESRWRRPRPLEQAGRSDEVARAALLNGTAVGVDKLGPSIAMLPTADAASIAFAEVSSFVDYWIELNGAAALRLLLADLRGLRARDADAALVSVTGYPLQIWLRRWQEHLRRGEPGERTEPSEPRSEPIDENDTRSVAQRARLGDLLARRGALAAARSQYRAGLASAPREAALRFRVAKTEASLAPRAFGDAVGALADIDALHAGWLALHGRFMKERGKIPESEADFETAIALDPYRVEAACEGHGALGTDVHPNVAPAPMPTDSRRRSLCEAARMLARD